MNAEAIRGLLHRRRFEVLVSSGEVYQVRHPEFVILLPSRLVVTDPATDCVAILSLIHVTEVRMLQAAGQSDSA